MKTAIQENSQAQPLNDLIRDIEYAMLTTMEKDGTLHSRPMRTEAMQPDGTLLFFTLADSAKAEEVKKHIQVSLTYMSGQADMCVAIAGRARLARHVDKMKKLWKTEYKAWFPKGLNDPELTMLEVIPTRAEYWKTLGEERSHAQMDL